MSHRVEVKERVEGNGLYHREGDPDDLADTLLRLKEPGLRRSLGETGQRKISSQFSWRLIARRRLDDSDSSQPDAIQPVP